MRRSLLLSLLALALALPASASARGLQLGFYDNSFAGPLSTAQPWLTRAVASGAQIVRINGSWAAARRPAAPTDPADPAYDWRAIDQTVRNLDAAGLQALLSITGAPAWAEGAGRPRTAAAGSWRPDAAAFRAFAAAVGRRYDGTYPDPLNAGRALPKVRYFQPWNEPNLAKYLSPQWVRTGGRWVAESPSTYRSLQNAFYAGIKAGRPDATVVTAGTAPFGDLAAGGTRMQPARFYRELLCLTAALKRRAGCTATTSFDAYAHHPYSVRGPASPAFHADDVSVADVSKLVWIVKAGVAAGTVVPKKAKPLWVTEVSWDSNPPDPDGVPAARHARWVEQAFQVLWKQGASVVLWFLIRDQAPTPSYAATYQSGIYRSDGRAKPAQTAFAFPLVRDGGRVWLRPPADGTVVVEAQVRGRWRTVVRRSARAHAVLWLAVRLPTGTSAVRARQGGRSSLPWPVPSAVRR